MACRAGCWQMELTLEFEAALLMDVYRVMVQLAELRGVNRVVREEINQ